MRVSGLAAGFGLLAGLLDGSVAIGTALAQPPPLALQEREAALAADVEAVGDVPGLLRRALVALRAGRPVHANEVLERAETRLLPRVAPAAGRGPEATPRRGPVAQIAAARAALGQGDTAGAAARVEAALAGLDRRRPRRR